MEFEKTLALKDRQLLQLQELCRRLQKQSHGDEPIIIPLSQPEESPSNPLENPETVPDEAEEPTPIVAQSDNLIAQEG